MTTEATYSLIERNHYGAIVNQITGLVRARAELVADTLRRGDAYTTTERTPWTCEVVAELTPAEQTAAIVDKWLADGASLTRADHLVACLRRVADVLEPLGDRAIPHTGLKVEMHLFSSDGSTAVRMSALDELAAVFGRHGEMNEAGHYHTGYSHGGGLRMVTIAEPASATQPKPLVSDETIREAEWISKQVAPMDLGLPQAECGCPIKSDRDGNNFVDHCQLCIEQAEASR